MPIDIHRANACRAAGVVLIEPREAVRAIERCIFGHSKLWGGIVVYSAINVIVGCRVQYFEGTVVSALEKCVKPDRRLYEILLNRYDLKPEECLFIDDLRANCDGAERAGMTAYCYDGDYEKLVAYLKENGIEF